MSDYRSSYSQASLHTPYFHPQMKCEVLRMMYDYFNNVGHAYLAEGAVVDMAGAVEFFTWLEAEAENIFTHIGNNETPDRHFAKVDGNWIELTVGQTS